MSIAPIETQIRSMAHYLPSKYRAPHDFAPSAPGAEPFTVSELDEDTDRGHDRDHRVERLRGLPRRQVDARRSEADVLAVEHVDHFGEERQPAVRPGERAVAAQVEPRVDGQPGSVADAGHEIRAAGLGVVAGNREVAADAQLGDEAGLRRVPVRRPGVDRVPLIEIPRKGFAVDDITIPVRSVSV